MLDLAMPASMLVTKIGAFNILLQSPDQNQLKTRLS